jgi:hypothetical protein
VPCEKLDNLSYVKLNIRLDIPTSAAPHTAQPQNSQRSHITLRHTLESNQWHPSRIERIRKARPSPRVKRPIETFASLLRAARFIIFKRRMWKRNGHPQFKSRHYNILSILSLSWTSHGSIPPRCSHSGIKLQIRQHVHSARLHFEGRRRIHLTR